MSPVLGLLPAELVDVVARVLEQVVDAVFVVVDFVPSPTSLASTSASRSPLTASSGSSARDAESLVDGVELFLHRGVVGDGTGLVDESAGFLDPVDHAPM